MSSRPKGDEKECQLVIKQGLLEQGQGPGAARVTALDMTTPVICTQVPEWDSPAVCAAGADSGAGRAITDRSRCGRTPDFPARTHLPRL